MATAVVGVATFFAVWGGPDSGRQSEEVLNGTTTDPLVDAGTMTTYSNPELGIEFEYQTGSDGYVLQEHIPTDTAANLVRTIVLMQSADAAVAPPAGGERPPVISISVFKNTKKQFPRTWADQNVQYSLINLAQGEIEETVVGGTNAIRYNADGLYASDNVVVAHGENMYVITGQYMDAGSDIRADFAPLVASIRFIPPEGQE